MNKFLLAIVSTLATQGSLFAQYLNSAVLPFDANAAASVLTLQEAPPLMYGTHPFSVDVTVNGVPATLTDVGLGMTLNVTPGAAGSAPRVAATGMSLGSSLTKDELQEKLVGTTWSWSQAEESPETLTFGGAPWQAPKPGVELGQIGLGAGTGMLRLNSQYKLFKSFEWEATAGNYVEGVARRGGKFRVFFNDALTEGWVFEEGRPSRPIKRMPKPRELSDFLLAS